MSLEIFGPINHDYQDYLNKQDLLKQMRVAHWFMLKDVRDCEKAIITKRLETLVKLNEDLTTMIRENAEKLNAVGIKIGEEMLESLSKDNTIIEDNKEFIELLKKPKE